MNLPPTEDDPQRRRPDISKAKAGFDWEPRMALNQGNTNVLWFRKKPYRKFYQQNHPSESLSAASFPLVSLDTPQAKPQRM